MQISEWGTDVRGPRSVGEDRASGILSFVGDTCSVQSPFFQRGSNLLLATSTNRIAKPSLNQTDQSLLHYCDGLFEALGIPCGASSFQAIRSYALSSEGFVHYPCGTILFPDATTQERIARDTVAGSSKSYPASSIRHIRTRPIETDALDQILHQSTCSLDDKDSRSISKLVRTCWNCA